MKGKIELRFLAPNTGKVRTRLDKVSDDFTQKLRACNSRSCCQDSRNESNHFQSSSS